MIDEEMAEDYAKGLCKTCTVDTCRYSTIQTCAIKESIKQAHFDGLKAGRPKWHKVADGDLPKDEDWKWCISYRGYYYVAKYEEMFGCWTNQEYSEVMQPYAWKEIVLPIEVKEND